MSLPPPVERPVDVAYERDDLGRYVLTPEKARKLGAYIRQLEAERDALRAHPFFGDSP